MSERFVWFNGRAIPESEARIDIRDLGFIYGDSVYDTSRTVGGEPFMFAEHVARLFRSLKYAMIEVPYSEADVYAATVDLASRNKHLLGPNEDYWVCQRVSTGIAGIDQEPPVYSGPTFYIECKPLPYKRNAVMLRDGADLIVSSHRRTAPDALSPNAKTSNCLNMFVGQRQIDGISPGAKAVLLDHRGFVAEGAGFNIFFVIDGRVVTPNRAFVLSGFGRQLAMDACRKHDIDCVETDVSLYDAAIAEEVFLTSTSLCICPVRNFNGYTIGTAPGPITSRLMDECKKTIGIDYVSQYLAHL